MYDRWVRSLAEKHGYAYPLENITPALTGDVVVGNLEGPITSNASVATDTHLVFTFDPKTAPVLRQAGFTTLSLANNHTLNFGQSGLTTTRAALDRAGLASFGDPRNRSGYTYTRNINGQRVALVGYHGLAAGLETVVSDVQEARANSDVVIVMAHGGSEYNLGFTTKQQHDYHALIDAGADLVIAAHPHVVEPLEIYHHKLIAYSLGNFIFDQYFSADTQQGLLMHLTFGSELTVTLAPLDLTKSQPKVAESTLARTLLQRLASTSIATNDQLAMIRSGTLTLPLP